MRELVPLRHLHLLSACADLYDNEFAYEDENWLRRVQPIQDPFQLSAVDGFQEFSYGQPDSEVSQPLALLPDSVGRQRSKGDLSTELYLIIRVNFMYMFLQVKLTHLILMQLSRNLR